MIGVITNSMRTTMLDCPYRFFLEYILRLTPKKTPEYFRWGEIIHRCKEAQATERPVEEVIEEIRQEAEEIPLPAEEIEQTEEMCTLAPQVLDAHMLKWHEMDEHYEAVDVERKFSIPLPCGIRFEGKIDGILKDIRSGDIYLEETKTASRTGDAYWGAKELDSQPMGYCLGAQRGIGVQVQRVLYDVLKKPQLRPRKGETREEFVDRLGKAYLLGKDKYFERRPIQFEQETIDGYLWDIDMVAREMLWRMENAYWPKHHPTNRFGGCAFMPYCTRNDMSGFYVRKPEQINPELR